MSDQSEGAPSAGARDGPGPAACARDGVLRIHAPESRWLSTGFDGGARDADAAYNVTVPEGWPETDLAAYVRERRARAGFDEPGPALLTGVDQRHARVARLAPVTAVATVGVSNPAALPTDADALREPAGSFGDAGSSEGSSAGSTSSSDDGANASAADDEPSGAGTVNVILYADRSLEPGALANLVAVAAEAKAATLLARTGFPGTTTDAVVVGSDPAAGSTTFSGSATDVGAAARACVRDAIAASLDARYAGDATVPADVAEADHGVVTDRRASVRPVER